MRAAAVVSASRSPVGSASSAALNSAGFNSSAATLGALTRSKSAVYSRTAWSPRARTSAMMAATEVSIATSSAVPMAVSRASADSKSAAEASSLRIGASAIRFCLRYCGFSNRLEQRLDGVALELERRWIDDQPRTDRYDVFDRDEIVRLERVAAAHQVDDRLGKTHERGELHRAVEPDQVHVHALGGEVLARRRDVFGCHSQSRAALDCPGIVETASSRDDQPAATYPQVDRLVKTLTTVLEQHVLSSDAQVSRTILNISRHIRIAHDDEPHIRPAAANDQLARCLRILLGDDARRSEKRQGFLE